jgi:1-acyl-sn-glycerol-3-phosphate acyltransferase
MTALRTILFRLLFYGLTVPAVIVALPVAAAGPAAIRAYGKGWAGLHAFLARWVLGIRTRIEGAPPRGAVLVAAKHEAHYEPLELIRILDMPAPVMKRQLGDIPLWGWIARRYGAIPIDRSGGAAALRAMMREAEHAKRDGRPILIFPEGTRVLPGEQPPLQSGFAALYRLLDLPVVPVALDSGRLWPKKGARRSGVVTMRFGDPIPPGLPRRELEAAVHRQINALNAQP